MKIMLCPICGSGRLFIDPDDKSKIGCLNCSKLGKHYKEIIPLVTPQEENNE